ncbi:MAG TPA: tripartite tricarboxylate transporter substrate binding protein [Alphaproteobacteria bacterium]
MLARVVLMAAVCLIANAALAAETYPARPVKLVVPFPPGGSGDLIGRTVSGRIGDALGQPIVVENHVGAGGRIGVDFVAKSPPNGYTIGIGTVSTLSMAPVLYANLPYDPLTSFAPIGMIVDSPVVIVVNAAVPAHSVKELVALAKAKPGQLNFASIGPGSLHHFSAEDFKLRTGTNMVHVPYTGSAPALIALLANEVQLLFDNVASFRIENFENGKLRALAVASSARLPQLPDVPTAAEAGVPGYEASAWFGLIAPAGTSPEIVARLNKALRQSLIAKDVLDVLAKQALNPGGGTPEHMTQVIKDGMARWAHVVEATGFKLE